MSPALKSLPARPLRESEVDALEAAEGVESVAVTSYWYDGGGEAGETLAVALVMVTARRWSVVEYVGDGWTVAARGERGGVEAHEAAQAALRELEGRGPG